MAPAGRGKKRRHPVRWVGARMIRDFVQVPNALVRDDKVTNAAFRVAVLLRSHAEGYPTSVVDMALTLKCARNTVSSALECLEALRWLVIRDTRTVDAEGLVHSEYVMHACRQFTPEEARELAEPILVEPAQKLSRHDDEADRACSEIEQEACSEIEQGKPAQKLSTREHHLEHHLKIEPVPQSGNADGASALATDDLDYGPDEDLPDDEPIRHPRIEMTDDWWPSERVYRQLLKETGRPPEWLDHWAVKFRDGRLSDGQRSDERSLGWDDEVRSYVLWAHRDGRGLPRVGERATS